jgi:hypothetical protein
MVNAVSSKEIKRIGKNGPIILWTNKLATTDNDGQSFKMQSKQDT